MSHALLTVALLLVAGTARADPINRRVISVHDGDTLTVLVEKQQIKIRLAEIDAPELRQAFGQRSRQSPAIATDGRQG